MRKLALHSAFVASAGVLIATATLVSPMVGCKARPAGSAPPAATAPAVAPSQAIDANDVDAADDDPTGGGTIAPPPKVTSDPTALHPRDDLPGLFNFAKVSDVLYRGAQPTAEGFRTLKSMGIKTVIDLRWLHSDRALIEGTGLRYAHFHAKAWHPEDEDIARALRIIHDPGSQPVFVHCQHGADRTGVTVAAYRIVEENWTPADAAKELPNFRFHPIWTQVIDYLARFDSPAMKMKVKSLGPIEPLEIP
ncbi:MAG: hypothetical protein NVS3B20_02370 [Polyangiales bacterium]